MSETPDTTELAGAPPPAEGERRWAVCSRSRVGAAHLRLEIVCQDDSAAKVIDDRGCWTGAGQGTWAYAAVADGHGSVRHFRSHTGAQLAVEAMRQTFMALRKQALDDQPLRKQASDDRPAADPMLLRLWRTTAARHVVNEWRAGVYRHLLAHPPGGSQHEPGLDRLLDHVRGHGGEGSEERFLSQLAAFRAHSADIGGAEGLDGSSGDGITPLPLANDPNWNREELGGWHASAYGTTLLGVLVGPEALYWLRIGDGAMIQILGGRAVDLAPPPDEAIANETPSLSDDRAVDQIEVAAVPLVDGEVPSALVLTTDGVPNSYTQPSGFLEFCEEVARRARADRDDVAAQMPAWLDELSRRGSGDDMSVAMTWSAGTDEDETGVSGAATG